MQMQTIAPAVLAMAAVSACAQPKLPATVMDDCESLQASRSRWEMTGVKAELSAEHATGGKGCLKLTFGPAGGAMVWKIGGKALDWSAYRALRFDVFSPQAGPVDLTLRVDDADSGGFRDRYEPCDALFLPPGRPVPVVVDLTRLLARNGRLLDPGRIRHFNLHLSKAPRPVVLYVDSFRFEPLPAAERPRRVPPAARPLVLDDAESLDASRRFWNACTARLASSDEHATGGRRSLKVTFPAGAAWSGIAMQRPARPADWRAYNCLAFDAHNASAEPVELHVRIDDAVSKSHETRYNVSGIKLPAGGSRAVRINLKRPVTKLGRPMDKSRIVLLTIFAGTSKAERVVHLDNVRLAPGGGGLRNEVRRGALPGQTPETLGKALLDDPQIRPLIGVFRAMGPRRMAIVSHSASITAHWSTSGAFFDIAAEAVRAVNPKVEYKGFHRGGMGAGTAVATFLKPMIAYKPTDTYILVVPRPWAAYTKLGDDMKAAGSRVFYFDAIKAWGPYPPKTCQDIRDYCKRTGATFLELMARGWGAPGSQDWVANDDIHMTTAGHVFYARELLKEWARIYAVKPAPAAGKKGSR